MSRFCGLSRSSLPWMLTWIVVGGAGQHRAGGAGNVDDRSAFGKHPLAGGDRHLPALGHGQRAVLEVGEAAGHDLDPGLILAVGKCREIVELADRPVD